MSSDLLPGRSKDEQRSRLTELLSRVGVSRKKFFHANVFFWRDYVFLKRELFTKLLNQLNSLGASFDAHSRIHRKVPAEKRSVVFLNNNYYTFYYLARALRARGWDAISVSYDDPNGANANFLHRSDLCLYDADPDEMDRKIQAFQADALGRFNMIQFYGRGHMSIFPRENDPGPPFSNLPIEFLRFKQHGVKIGYSVCGCLDGVAQSSVNAWSGCCERCIWQNRPEICCDHGNLAWGHKLEMFCDVICCEGFPAIDYQRGPKTYREPLTTALDPEFWKPDLPIPDKYRLKRAPGELIVYHAVGNYELRSNDVRNIKGTPATIAAVERLRSEGVNVRLEFVSNVPNTDVRFIQSQADVIVDQLNYGRYGATAREGMMLGKPTICYINCDEKDGETRLRSIETCPLVSATEDTVYDVLRDLLSNEEKRREIGARSREFALEWHAADACAARFEDMYDRLQRNFPPEG